MRKRRKRTLACYLTAALLFLSTLFYFSTFLEVSYFVHAHTRASSILGSIRTLNRFSVDLHSGIGTQRITNLSQKCEVLQVAIVCAGYESSFRSVTLVKSLLYHRRQAIKMHFVVDDVAAQILPTLFDTWQLPSVEVLFYNSTSFINRVSWIPNRHYSREYGLLKLILTDIFPDSIKKVAVLDTDVLFVEDIARLWEFWSEMNSAQALAVVENLSDWYMINASSSRKPWPAWKRGFNTGVMLMDLEKLRNMNWTFLWEEITAENLKDFGATQLADQDIINAVISRKPGIVYKLPCEWNLQMGYQSRQNLCPARISELKVVHWNSPKKTRTQNPYAIFFRRHFQTFTQMDGNLLRTEMLRCSTELKSSELHSVYDYEDNDDGCGELRHARNIKYRTQLFIRRYAHQVDDIDVTLSTQLSMDRFVLFESLLNYWSGPISAAIYLSDSELAQLMQYLADTKVFYDRSDIAIHAVFKEGVHFPINYLRNVALNATRTPFVFLADVDFLPMPGLYELIRERLSSNSPLSGKAFVIPAFESKGYRNPIVPASKAELLVLLDTGRIQIFRQDIWTQGHAATDYDRWRTTDTEYSVAWRTDYEPYVVVARNETPPYDNRFVGFGWNKVSHIMSLNAAGFDFIVLPGVFIVHQPHSASFEIAKYRSSPIYRRCLKALKGEFVRDLLRWNGNQRSNRSDERSAFL
ncbi:Glycosyltransferase-like protein LARGE2 [Toxocara canis]|nr:Glycosyltransferase-like protein LARGE2 [Toxocara canis]